MDDATRRVGAGGNRTTGRARTPRPVEAAATPEERTQEIREEIAQTRGNMSETIDAIQERLKPANLVAQAGETVRNAANEKVKHMANAAGHAADQVMDSSFMESVRSNPIPAALIGIGAAWWWFSSRAQAKNGGVDRYGRRDWRSLSSRAAAYDTSDMAVGTTGTSSEDWDDEPSRTQELADRVQQNARRARYRARVGFDKVMRDNPLALGAAAAIVGAAVAMTVPNTEVENELMGDARDTVVERARTAAGDVAERVKDAASEVQDIASRTVDTIAPGNRGRSDQG